MQELAASSGVQEHASNIRKGNARPSARPMAIKLGNAFHQKMHFAVVPKLVTRFLTNYSACAWKQAMYFFSL